LRLDLGPGEVDVNVHPAKSAVRLRGGRSAYPLVVGTIRSAISPDRAIGSGLPDEEGETDLVPIGQFAGRLPATVRKRLAEVVHLLQCYLRAGELGMRAAEESLRSDLDVKGLRAQVLGRIEELEEQEREKEELLAGVAAVAEEHGLDAGPLKAVLGG
jgi:hypothetical protein